MDLPMRGCATFSLLSSAAVKLTDVAVGLSIDLSETRCMPVELKLIVFPTLSDGIINELFLVYLLYAFVSFWSDALLSTCYCSKILLGLKRWLVEGPAVGPPPIKPFGLIRCWSARCCF